MRVWRRRSTETKQVSPQSRSQATHTHRHVELQNNEPPTWSSRFSNVTVPRREMPSLPTTTCGSAVRRGAA